MSADVQYTHEYSSTMEHAHGGISCRVGAMALLKYFDRRQLSGHQPGHCLTWKIFSNSSGPYIFIHDPLMEEGKANS